MFYCQYSFLFSLFQFLNIPKTYFYVRHFFIPPPVHIYAINNEIHLVL